MTLSKLSLVTTRTPSSTSILAREIATRQSAAKQNTLTFMTIQIPHFLFFCLSFSLSFAFPARRSATCLAETKTSSGTRTKETGKTPPSARRTRDEWASATLRRRVGWRLRFSSLVSRWFRSLIRVASSSSWGSLIGCLPRHPRPPVRHHSDLTPTPTATGITHCRAGREISVPISSRFKLIVHLETR